MEFTFVFWDIFSLLMLLAGVALTIITIRRMARGAIRVPGWAKVLLTTGMIFLQVILLLSILPPIEVDVDNPFISEDTHIVTPADPESSEVKIPD